MLKHAYFNKKRLIRVKKQAKTIKISTTGMYFRIDQETINTLSIGDKTQQKQEEDV